MTCTGKSSLPINIFNKRKHTMFPVFHYQLTMSVVYSQHKAKYCVFILWAAHFRFYGFYSGSLKPSKAEKITGVFLLQNKSDIPQSHHSS